MTLGFLDSVWNLGSQRQPINIHPTNNFNHHFLFYLCSLQYYTHTIGQRFFNKNESLATEAFQRNIVEPLTVERDQVGANPVEVLQTAVEVVKAKIEEVVDKVRTDLGG